MSHALVRLRSLSLIALQNSHRILHCQKQMLWGLEMGLAVKPFQHQLVVSLHSRHNPANFIPYSSIFQTRLLMHDSNYEALTQVSCRKASKGQMLRRSFKGDGYRRGGERREDIWGERQSIRILLWWHIEDCLSCGRKVELVWHI